ncbi:MAG: hypothetical protein KDB79_15140, partial [Acidobacteria bacterium]|nr:hypothetical protein [Acidobacteriota bacterium]
MKQILFTLFILIFSATTFAQSDDARFDADLKRLNRRFENVESIKRLEKDANTEVRINGAIRSAENELGRFKKKYPDHDVSKFEKALADFKNPQAATTVSVDSGGRSSTAGVSDFARVEDFVAAIEEILDLNPPRFLGGKDDAVDEAKQILADFRAKMDKTITPEFLALAKDNSNRKIQRIGEKAARESSAMANRLSSIKPADILAETDQKVGMTKYYLAAFMLEKISLLSKIFENEAEITS